MRGTNNRKIMVWWNLKPLCNLPGRRDFRAVCLFPPVFQARVILWGATVQVVAADQHHEAVRLTGEDACREVEPHEEVLQPVPSDTEGEGAGREPFSFLSPLTQMDGVSRAEQHGLLEADH